MYSYGNHSERKDKLNTWITRMAMISLNAMVQNQCCTILGALKLKSDPNNFACARNRYNKSKILVLLCDRKLNWFVCCFFFPGLYLALFTQHIILTKPWNQRTSKNMWVMRFMAVLQDLFSKIAPHQVIKVSPVFSHSMARGCLPWRWTGWLLGTSLR